MSNPDFWLDWNSDLLLTPSGSIQVATGWDSTRQGIVRSLITNPAQTLPDGTTTTPDYIFEPDFGVGLGAMVDQNYDTASLQALEQKIQNAVLNDPGVNSSAPPSVQFNQPNNYTLDIIISVTQISGEPGTIALAVT
jgi:hypothetical protein